MITKELIIIGGGPAGLAAARSAAEAGCHVLIIERNPRIGGQLIKQTHKFFGSEKQFAKTRGFNIAKKLVQDVEELSDFVEILCDATVVGLYTDHVLTVLCHETYTKYHFEALVVATGAGERMLAFENNDLPGIYGAGAVQTLMNLYGVLPGNEIVMVGSGNIGLIVSYQLIQAGVHVKALLEAAPKIGGYKVHASKLRRLGVDILTSTTIKRAIGTDSVEQIETIALDDSWNMIPGTEKSYDVDGVCIAVGLTPLYQLLAMAGCDIRYIPELGGMVPLLNDLNETTIANIFVAGDVAGIEEASSAIVEGYLSGLVAAKRLGHSHPEYESKMEGYHYQLKVLRSGPFGAKIRAGLKKIQEAYNAR
ncbi:MAG: FAD-dependent oxidoreductase [Bacteroidales bacterium]|jgi:sarcosine oxidase subunit alpha